MVFGFSDLAHKFHPLAFMFTSHETESDFSHFFKSLEGILLQILNIDLKKIFKNTMIDACQAMANCIKKRLSRVFDTYVLLSP